MAITQIIKNQPRLLRLRDAEVYCGGGANLKSLRDAGYVKPLVQRKSNTTFDVRDLDLAIDRAQLDGFPAGKTGEEV